MKIPLINSLLKVAVILGAMILLTTFRTANAQEIPLPDGTVILEVTGNIKKVNDGDSLKIDLSMLQTLPEVSFVTDSPWTEQPTKFTGVRISDLLEYLGAGSDNFRATALDDYWNDLEGMNFDEIPAIVAYKRDDKEMRLRDLGPLWIMFPFDDYPELDTEKYKRACVWQLIGIEVL